MKLPEFLFKLINPCMILLLRSPLHSILSGSVMAISFIGRKSGRHLQVPVRYAREGNRVICFTGKEGKWWHNFKSEAPVSLLLRRQTIQARAQAYYDGHENIRSELERFLARFPQDAIYHDIRIEGGGMLNMVDLEAALPGVVMVLFDISA